MTSRPLTSWSTTQDHRTITVFGVHKEATEHATTGHFVGG